MQESIERQISRLGGLGLSGLACLFAVGLIACAATTASNSGSDGPAVISDVQVEQVGDTTVGFLCGGTGVYLLGPVARCLVASDGGLSARILGDTLAVGAQMADDG